MKQKFFAIVIVVMILFVSSCKNNVSNSENLDTEGSTMIDEKYITVDLCDTAVREYLDAQTEEDQFDALKKLSKTHSYFPNLELKWDVEPYQDEYTVKIADNPQFKKAFSETTYMNYITIGYCVPGCRYWYKIENSDGEIIESSSFYCEDKPVRFVNVEGVANMRDLGGWQAKGGKVKYGMLYRSADTQTIRPEGINTITKKLNIKTEIDLRDAKGSDGGQIKCAFGDDYNFYKLPFYCSMYNIPSSFVYQKTVQKSFVDLFEVLSDKDNYPIVFHCTSGADRTGFIAFIINGLLGVSYADLTRDYELTSASGSLRARAKMTDTGFDYTITTQDIRNGSGYCWSLMYETIMSDYGDDTGDLSYAIEKYLLSLGVLEDNIENTKNILLK